MLCRMSPDVCTNKLEGVQFTVLAEFCGLHNLGKHVDGEARDDDFLGSQHYSWSHVPTGIQTAAARCGTSTSRTSFFWTWMLLKS